MFLTKNKPKKAMKKTIKRACAGMFAIMMAVSAMSIPSSAASVSGQVSGINCGGSNFISDNYAFAETHAASSMTLNVSLRYRYAVIVGQDQRLVTTGSSNANNPVSTISTSANKPTGNATRSHSCMSSHNAVYHSTAWSGDTNWEYY